MGPKEAGIISSHSGRWTRSLNGVENHALFDGITVLTTSATSLLCGQRIKALSWYLFSLAIRNRMPTLSVTTARCVTTGWLSTCSTHWRTFRITPLAGFGIIITNDRTWGLGESLLNRNWPWRPNLYF